METTFDSLPDTVACTILSRLQNAQSVAICSAVCRRWRSLCSSVDSVSFESFKLFENKLEQGKASCLERIVSSMLANCNSGIKELIISYHPVVWPWIPRDHFSEDEVCAWLSRVQGSLEKLVLVDPNREHSQPQKLVRISLCSRLRWLNLCYGIIPDIPTDFHRMENLRTCVLDLIVINDSALETLVQLCPMLVELKVNSCKGLLSPSLVARNLCSLEFVYEMDICEANIACLCLEAPRLSRLCLSYVEELITNGEALSELGLLCHVKPKIRDLSYLSALDIKGEIWLLESILELVRLGVNVTRLHVDSVIENKAPIRLDTFFQHLPSLRTLYIGADMFECMQAGGGGFTNSICLPRLEEITAVVTYGNKGSVAVLGALLKCSSSLKSLKINAQQLTKGVCNVMFFTDVLSLQREYPKVKISLDCPYSLL